MFAFVQPFGNPLVMILAVPIIAAIILLIFVRDEQRDEARTIAIVATAIILLLSVYVFLDMNRQDNFTGSDAINKAAQGRSHFIEEINVPWVPALGINFHLGVDGVT